MADDITKTPNSEEDTSAAEAHVDAMMAIDSPAALLVPEQAASVPAPKVAKIAIIDGNTSEPPISATPEPETLTAPLVPGKKKPKEPVSITVKQHEEDPAATAPEVSTAPEPPKPAAKRIAISEPEVTDPEPQEPVAPVVPLEPIPPVPQSVRPSLSTTPAPKVTPTLPSKLEPDELADGLGFEESPAESTDIDKVVDDIVASESDQLLAAAPAAPPTASAPAAIKPADKRRNPIAQLFHGWLHSSLARWITALVLIALLAGAGLWPTSRYAALNAAGVRSSASVQVTDQSTFQPLKNVEVKIGDQTATTDAQGNARLEHLKLGPTILTVQKRAFAPITEHMVVGWGSNPLGSRSIAPVGSQYTFVVTDYLSGKPVKAAANAGDADAQSDDKGVIKLTLPHDSPATLQVSISAADYRREQLTLDLSSKQDIALKLVPARPEVFVSKRSGKYDVYRMDIDGKNEKVMLAGTGNERDDMVLVPHPTANVLAVVSTRDDKRNADGYLLSTLTMINLDDGTSRTVTQSEQISIVNWVNDRLVYVQIAAGASAANPSRQRLMGYDYKAQDNKQLATSNYFNDVVAAGGRVYYAPSSSYQGAGATVGLFRVNNDGSNKQTIVAQETWNVFRTSYDHLIISIPNQWYDFQLNDTAAKKLDGQPGNLTNRVYVDSPDGKHSLWIDMRDGKGTLLSYDTSSKSDTVLRAQSGIKNPVRWVDNHTVIYRVSTDQETADYALSLDGGDPIKLKDVTSTGGVDKWYYY